MMTYAVRALGIGLLFACMLNGARTKKVARRPEVVHEIREGKSYVVYKTKHGAGKQVLHVKKNAEERKGIEKSHRSSLRLMNNNSPYSMDEVQRKSVSCSANRIVSNRRTEQLEQLEQRYTAPRDYGCFRTNPRYFLSCENEALFQSSSQTIQPEMNPVQGFGIFQDYVAQCDARLLSGNPLTLSEWNIYVQCKSVVTGGSNYDQDVLFALEDKIHDIVVPYFV